MTEPIMQQLIISGVGGQGILFVTRLLAEAAIKKGLPVFTSETHGMAQRGGTVLSHFKVGDFSSPLIRPKQADGLLVLKAENIAVHKNFLKSNGWAIANGEHDGKQAAEIPVHNIDADSLAQEIGNPQAANLIVLGFALAKAGKIKAKQGKLFCTMTDIKSVLRNRFGKNKKMLEASLKALEAGYET
ncbi:Indolepyruvate oxidoreductase subunit IorB (EC [Olavius sp. associated proteobacterium Delta 1]|nr:Indolepyruvate oxidoreductase subunit IorB (EC [Olavius sp. associated proteobacterium Delta 1]